MGYIGESDRLNAIVGYCGALTDEHEQGLGVYLHYKTSKGVGIGIRKILEVGGTIHQVGDFEVTGYIPWDCIEDALKLIRASKLMPGRPGVGKSAPVQNAYAS